MSVCSGGNGARYATLAAGSEAEKAGRCLRETPITFRIETGLLLEGIVDLAFEENDKWTVLDFKTDTELKHDRPAYERQVSIYAAAIAEVTGKPAAGVLVHV